MLGQHQMRAIQLLEQGKLSWPRLPAPAPHSVHVGPQRLGQRMVRRGSPQQRTAPCWRPRALSGPQPLSELEYHLLAKKGMKSELSRKKSQNVTDTLTIVAWTNKKPWVELKKRKWRGSPLCNICGKQETVDHIFFSCIVARFVWACFKEALGWDRPPMGWQDFLDNWILLGCRDYNAKLFLLTIVLWTIWTSRRNKRAIEGKFPTSPSELLFKINVFLQKWMVMLRDGDRAKVADWCGTMQGWTEPFLETLKRRPPEDLFLWSSCKNPLLES